MVSLTGIPAINQALDLISQELKFIQAKAGKARSSLDQRDKITATDLKGFIQTLGGRLALLDQRTDDLLKLFHSAKKSMGNETENLEYSTTASWEKDILVVLKILKEEQALHILPANFPKWVAEEDVIDDSRNVVTVFLQMLENIEQHIRQERYKLKVEKPDTQKNS